MTAGTRRPRILALRGDVCSPDPADARRRARHGDPDAYQPAWRPYSNTPKPLREYIRGEPRADWAEAALHRALAEHGPAPEDLEPDDDEAQARLA